LAGLLPPVHEAVVLKLLEPRRGRPLRFRCRLRLRCDVLVTVAVGSLLDLREITSHSFLVERSGDAVRVDAGKEFVVESHEVVDQGLRNLLIVQPLNIVYVV
jgi:hypothetical protein